MLSNEPARAAMRLGASVWTWLTRWLEVRDLIGVALGLAFTTWTVRVALQVGGRPWPLVALVTSAILAVIAGDRWGTRQPLVIPILVASSPVVLSVVYREPLLGDGPLGYTNASGALFVVAAAGALVATASKTHRVVRGVGYAAAAVWISVPWISGARTAAIAAGLLSLAVLTRNPSVTRRIVLSAGSVLTLAGIVLTLVLGINYEPGGRAGTIDRQIDATLGELRVALWSDAARLLREEPFWGVGPGRFAQVSPTAQARDDAVWAHNEYLQTTGEIGLAGGLLLLGLVAWTFARLWWAGRDDRSVAAAIALGGVAVNATIDYVWHFTEVVVCLALLVGAASARLNSPGTSSQVAISRRMRAAVVATLGLWVMLLLPIGAVNPTYTIPNGVARVSTNSGIEFSGAGGLVRSSRPPVALYEQIVANQALTIEMWAATHDVDQHGPARLVSSSEGIVNRNVTVGQNGDQLVFRLRTTETDWNATDPQLIVEGVFESTDLQHLVITTNADETRVFVDGVLRSDWNGPGGTFDDWIHAYPVVLGNETSGDRPWLGELRLMSIYDREMHLAEIKKRHSLGPSPQVTSAMGDPPVAFYPFEESRGPGVNDLSPAALGGELSIPHRVRAPAPDFVTVMSDVGDRPVVRTSLYVLAFGVWSILIVRSLRHRFTAESTVAFVAGGAIVIALAASLAQHARGGAPSALDLVAALIGCIAASLLLERLSPRRAENQSRR